MDIEDLKKGFGELTFEEKMSFLTGMGINPDSKACFKCRDLIRTEMTFKIYLRYGNKAFKNFAICPNCINKLFSIDKREITFFGFTINYKRLEWLSSYDKWTKKQILSFINECKKGNIIIDKECVLSDSSIDGKMTIVDYCKKYKLSLKELE